MGRTEASEAMVEPEVITSSKRIMFGGMRGELRAKEFWIWAIRTDLLIILACGEV